MLSKQIIARIGSDLCLCLNFDEFLDYLYDGKSIAIENNSIVVGDNLLSLLNLVKLRKTFKLAYVDPPYNTGNRFVYDDSAFSSYHPLWGNSRRWVEDLIYRLIVLRLVMAENGYVIFSIDDRELHNLIRIADYIFGIGNRLPTIVVKKNNNGKGSSKTIANQHEYVIVYRISEKSPIKKIPEKSRAYKPYDKRDEHGNYRLNGLFRKKGSASLRADRPNMYYPLYYDELGKVYTEFSLGRKAVFPIDSSGIERRWLWDEKRVREYSHLLFASKGGVIYVKDYNKEEKSVVPRSIWESPDYFTQKATLEVKADLGNEGIFETPKSLRLMRDIALLFPLSDGDCVLDVFAGSGSFSIATKMLARELGLDINTISLESDHKIRAEHPARRYGFDKISDITFKRLRLYLPDVKVVHIV